MNTLKKQGNNILDTQRREEKAPETECIWSQDDAYDGDGNWNSSCGETFMFIDDTPKGNGMKFCCYCGSRLIEKLYEPEPEDEE